MEITADCQKCGKPLTDEELMEFFNVDRVQLVCDECEQD